MASRAPAFPELEAAVERATREFVSVRHWGDTSFVSLPLYYPSGSPVTVRVSQTGSGFRVDDGGFAFRELESVGYQRSFANAADKARADDGLERDRRSVFSDAMSDELGRAISDIAVASWNITDRVFRRVAEQDEKDIEAYLRYRLANIFGESRLEENKCIQGESTNPWDVSAIVDAGGEKIVFQAVADHATSIYRTSTAFHDLAALPVPPKLVAVVRSKVAFGRRLSILSQAGRVIESDQPDETYMRAAA